MPLQETGRLEEAVAEHCDALDAGAVEDVADEGEHAPVLALLGRGLARAA